MIDYIDVFNGDADGLCALVQLRRSNPQKSKLVTGIKRDINLLKYITEPKKAHITVLDISFEKNHADVKRLLDDGCTIDYVDHHQTGQLLKHPQLRTDIDLSAETCTSLIIDKQLQGQYRAWAITAAFGDNLDAVAYDLGIQSGFSDTELDMLKQLGICLNYNGYGASVNDLFFHPAELFEKLKPFDTPFEFIEHDRETVEKLLSGYEQDMEMAHEVEPIKSSPYIEAIILPNQKWARRVGGVYNNELANNSPDKAHAILSEKDQDHFLVSIRAPLNRRFGADELARQFPTGGGRKAAAGINLLPKANLIHFLNAFEEQFIV